MQHYDFYFHLIRHRFFQHPYAKYSVADFWVFYYYEEIPVTNSENTLIYLFRQFLLESVLKDSRFKRIKKSTIDSNARSMMAAAVTMNIFLDCLREIAHKIDVKEMEFVLKFMENTRELYHPRFESYENYPKRLVQLETKLIQMVQEYMQEHEALLAQRKQDAVQFIDQITIIERELFDLKS